MGSGRGGSGSDQLRVLLSEGQPLAPEALRTPVVDGTALSAAEVEALLARLPDAGPGTAEPGDATGFNRPALSLPPPLVGDTITAPFPPLSAEPPDPAATATGPLHVLRVQPEGEVGVAPFLTVTFDQAMVPIGTVDDVASADVPVTLEPTVEGRWRWIGTRTLRFEVVPGPDANGTPDRLPAATEYTVTVPAGTRSANGGELAEAYRWTFATPAPQVASFTDLSAPVGLTPVLVAVFDQQVDPEAVLATVSLTADGDERAVRLASPEEIDADNAAARAVKGALAGRWVAFRPDEPLPAAADLAIEIGPGTPSAEGPRTTADASRHTGRTFDAFAVTGHQCNYGGPCQPATPIAIELNNPVDVDRFDPGLVTVSPDVPGLRVTASGNQLVITGATKGRTTYTVRVGAGLADTFGQTLGSDHTEKVEIGPAQPRLEPFPRQYLTTDPMAARPTLTVSTVNQPSLRVTAWKVSGGDLAAFQRFLETTWSDTDPGAPPFPEVLSAEVPVTADADAPAETVIDLGDAFAQAGTGQLVVRVAPTRTVEPTSDQYWMNRPTWAWVQATTLGIDAIVDGQRLLVWTTDLTTGRPRPGVEVTPLGSGDPVTTDGHGVATLPLTAAVLGLEAADPGGPGGPGAQAVLASSMYGGWVPSPVRSEARWYTFDDRGVYKPGETARITGWLRRLANTGDAQPELPGATTVTWQAFDPQGASLGSGAVPLNPLGGFNLSVTLPAGANLGPAWVQLTADVPEMDPGAASWTHQFQIQEFRTPEFEVTARPESPGPYYTTEPATVAADAAYYAGGPLPDADTTWTVTTTTTTYRPPGWQPFTFGIWQPWWLVGGPGAGFGDGFGGARFGGPSCFPPGCPPGSEAVVETFTGRTGTDGSHYLRLDFDGPAVDLPTTVTAEAAVTDVNRQTWASRTDLLVHPARAYVGLRTDRPFVEQGTPLRIDTVVTDVDGNPLADRPVEVTAGRLEWVYRNGAWTEELGDDTQTCALTSVAMAPGDPTPDAMRCELATDVGGTWQVTAVVTDAQGHRNRSQLTVWVSGGEARPARLVTQEQVTIVPDQPTYGAGDTARLLVQSPFGPASGLATVSRGTIVSTVPFEADDGSAVVEIPIDEAWTPGVTVQVDLVGTAPRLDDDGTPADGAPPRPAFAVGTVELKVPPTTRALAVTATPAAANLSPGADTTVTVAVAGPDGAPVAGADVALLVVDEAVLSLTGYDLVDPLDMFYGPWYSNVYGEYTRASILLGRPDLVAAGLGSGTDTASGDAALESAGGAPPMATATTAAARSSAPVDEMAAKAEGADQVGQPIQLRSDLQPVAVYAPDRSTGPDGTVTVDVPLPDNLTRYRVMAVAVDGAQRFGQGESTITARLPLMVRPSAPRFLNFGDRFELPVVVQNQTGAALEVDVALDAANLSLTGPAGKRVTVPANDRVEVRFPASAEQAGTARFRAVAATAAGPEADAAAVELPVYTPATTEAFATYGTIDGSDATAGGPAAVAQPFSAPSDVFPQFGGLEIDTSATALQSLTDAVLFLDDYRWDMAEAYASRILAVAALRDVLDAFDAEGLPDPAALNAQVDRDITRLVALQNDDGGFPSWQRGRRSEAWTSIQATHALLAAKGAGYSVPAEALTAALGRLADVESLFPAGLGPEGRATLSAYALNVRHQGGTGDPAKALALYRREGDALPLDALAWLWPALDDAAATAAIGRSIANSATDTAGAASFATGFTEQADAAVVAASDRRTDGIVLDALISEQPSSDLIPKVVNGLLASRVKGRWANAFENTFILLALKHYFDAFEAAEPSFTARAWLGDLYASEHRFEGRTTDRAATVVPMADVIAGGDQRVVVAKDGPGRLYWRLGLRYAPTDLTLDPRDEGFVVDRTYESTGDPDDVTRSADGTWRVKPGATVRVTVTMVADAVRHHVALVDPLPAGLEPLNPALASSPTPPPPPDTGDPAVPEVGWCWCWQWYEHQNLRDDRAEAFSSYLPGGTYTYSYTARATTPGTFVVPPARAEELYAPETFGRSASATVVVG
ncbi:MAG: alpha-2-macroglobulin family protein [Acidimicrobiales bacterium]